MPRVVVRVTPEELAALQARASEEDRSMQRYLHRLLFRELVVRVDGPAEGPPVPVSVTIREETNGPHPEPIRQLRFPRGDFEAAKAEVPFRPAPKPGKR